MSYDGDRCQFHEGQAAVARFGVDFKSAAAAVDPSLWAGRKSAFVLFWEDAWNWFMSIVHEVEEWFVHAAEDVWHFFVKIGETLYKVVVDCISSVVRAIELSSTRSRSFLKMIKWLGFIFSMERHSAHPRSAEKHLCAVCKKDHRQLGATPDRRRQNLRRPEGGIDAWANIKDGPSDTVASYQSTPPLNGQNSPGSNWALHHVKSNLGKANHNQVSCHYFS